jgi:hypothetical protein
VKDCQAETQEITKLLQELIKDCRKVATELPGVTCNKLKNRVNDWDLAVETGLSLDDLYKGLEDVCGGGLMAKNKIKRFESMFPHVGRRLSKAQKIVFQKKQSFEYWNGVEEF